MGVKHECLRIFGPCIIDPRFARIRMAPRLRKLKKQQKKFMVDERFKPLLKDDAGGRKKSKV